MNQLLLRSIFGDILTFEAGGITGTGVKRMKPALRKTLYNSADVIKNSKFHIALDTKSNRVLVGIEKEGKMIQWFEQTVYDQGNPTKFKFGTLISGGETKLAPKPYVNPNRYDISSFPVTAEAATKALHKAKTMIKEPLGPYNIIQNSCVSCAKDILNAGGSNAGYGVLTPKQLKNYVEKIK